LLAVLAYVLTAALALFAAHRAVEPLSRRAALALAAMPLVVTGKALLLGRVFAPLDNAFSFPPLMRYRAEFGIGAPRNGMLSDLYCQIIPWHKAVRWALAHGDWPLWNPFIRNGDILAAAAQPAPYLPLNLVSYLLPLPAALTYLAAANLLLAALAAYLWARSLGCREGAALLGALGWMAADAVVWWIGWPLGVATAVAPWIFLGVDRVVSAPGARSAALLAAGFCWLLLAGHPETAAHVVLLAFAYGLFALWPWRRGGWQRRTAWALAAGAAALLLCAIYLLPILEALPQTSERQDRESIWAAAERSLAPVESLRRLQSFVVPFRFGLAHAEVAADRPPHFDLLSIYAGSLLLPFAIHGLTASRRRERWFLAGMVLACALAAVAAPGVADLLARLPVFSLAINERLAFGAALGLALLAALGAESWCERPSRGVARAAAVWLVAAGTLFAASWPAMRGAGLSAAFLGARGAWLLAPLAAAALVAFRPRRPGRLLAVLVAALVVQRAWELAGFYPALPERVFYPRVAPLDALPANESPYRVVGRWYAMPANIGTMWELEDPRGYQALSFRRLVETYPLWSTSQGVWFNRVDDLGRPFLRFLNVRYALVDEPQAKPPAGWRRVRKVKRLQLWEQPRAAPRAFLPAKIWTGGRWPEALRRMQTWDNFRRRAWIEPLAAGPARPIEVSDNGRGTLEVRADGTGYRLSADMEARGWIVTSITAWRGWQAVAGGKRLPLAYANHAFLAIEAPPGRHDIRLIYRPASFVIGAWISAASLAGLGGAALARRRAQVRRSASMASP
jgi:hypothetical protein